MRWFFQTSGTKASEGTLFWAALAQVVEKMTQGNQQTLQQVGHVPPSKGQLCTHACMRIASLLQLGDRAKIREGCGAGGGKMQRKSQGNRDEGRKFPLSAKSQADT